MVRVRGDIVATRDGSNTLRHEVLGELYHSDRGARGEAEYVYIRNGLEFGASLFPERKGFSVFEMGFGTGLNAWLTWEFARISGLKVRYYTVEKYPLGMEMLNGLGYTSDERFKRLHGEDFDDGWFRLEKYEADLSEFDVSGLTGRMDVVYFDAFSPDVQPELWSEQVMRKMYGLLGPGGVLVTYSAKGMVKENLRNVGFQVSRLAGALGKRHMVRAVKK